MLVFWLLGIKLNFKDYWLLQIEPFQKTSSKSLLLHSESRKMALKFVLKA
jgi:hypothetical protein